MVNLNRHAAGNGGHRQGDPKSADRLFSYSARMTGRVEEATASFEHRAPSLPDWARREASSSRDHNVLQKSGFSAFGTSESLLL
jgi:hypothetical protein